MIFRWNVIIQHISMIILQMLKPLLKNLFFSHKVIFDYKFDGGLSVVKKNHWLQYDSICYTESKFPKANVFQKIIT